MSLGQLHGRPPVFHSVEGRWVFSRGQSLLPHHSSEVFLRYCQESFKLADAVLAHVSRRVSGAGALKQPDGFLVVGFGDVEGVLKGGLVLERRFFIHGTSVVPFPG
jgi:hypothetical protein